ncbi:MAG: ParB/RepB/Spo0J family partition protein [Proteobacteria bacterium]|nr:ParB/RepB/Spo0J family partition protein [Pseudomonadota bacterium]
MNAKSAGPRLGRGLAALMGEAAVAPAEPAAAGSQAAAGTRPLAIDLLRPGPFQPRGPMDPQALAELADSIRARGVLQPLLVRPDPADPGQYQIIAGERRWRAAAAAGLHEVPALVRPLSDSEAMAAALVENLQRADLNPIEEAQGYARLVEEFGMTQEALAQAIGKSRAHVGNTLRLLNLPEKVRAMVQSGALTAGHARALLTHPDPESLAAAVLARNLSVRQTEALASRKPDAAPDAGATSGGGREHDPDRLAVEQQLSDQLGLKVQLVGEGESGQVRIHYRTLDQLDSLIALLSR